MPPFYKRRISVITRLALIALLMALPVSAQAQSFTDEQKKEIEEIVKKAIMDNPQSILDSVEKHQIAKQEQELEKIREQIAVFQDSLGETYAPYTVGNPKGDVTVVEFFDYNCGYCKKAFEEVNKLIGEDKNVRVVFFEMPILGEQSSEAAKWSMAAAKQGKYFDFHRALMEFTGPKTEENLTELAKKSGVDADKAKKEKESPEIAKQIEANIAKAQELGFSGTPGFLIGKRPVFGYMELEAMKTAINTEREDAKKAKN